MNIFLREIFPLEFDNFPDDPIWFRFLIQACRVKYADLYSNASIVKTLNITQVSKNEQTLGLFTSMRIFSDPAEGILDLITVCSVCTEIGGQGLLKWLGQILHKTL